MLAQRLIPKDSSAKIEHENANNPALSGKLMKLFTLILIILPILSLVISMWSWLKYGIDIPVYDDWRQYNANDMGRLDLHYLLTPHNDTLYSFGLLLDSLAFRFLDGNSVAYQLISMVVVLGGLLALQWKLLRLCTQNKAVLAIAFSFTLLMLQPDTYWGWQNLAYHQAVPLVCMLGILYITLNKRSASWISLAGTFLLASVSGLTYISGAFASLALCSMFLIVGLLRKSDYGKNLLKVAAATILPAIATTAAQVWVIVEVQHGTHRADAPMAYPWESDFWYFMLGKIGRSLMLPMSHPTFSLTVAIVATAAVILITILSVFKLKSTIDSSTQKTLLITVSLAAIIFVYLLLISAGRTNLRPDDVTKAQDIFIYGFYRFHFFWVTLLWPWIALASLMYLRKRHTSNGFIFLATATSVGLWAAAIHNTTVLDNEAFFKSTMKQRSDGITCLMDKIQQSGAVVCPTVDLGDISQGIKNGRAAQASFARTLPILPVPLGTNNPPPLYRLSEHLDAVTINNATKRSSLASVDLKTANDPSILIKIPQDKDLTSCRTMNIVVSLSVQEPSVAQVFYMTPTHIGYSEDYSTTASIAASETPQQLSFTIDSPTGFEHEIRFDPVTASQNISVKELEVRCRSTANAN